MTMPAETRHPLFARSLAHTFTSSSLRRVRCSAATPFLLRDGTDPLLGSHPIEQGDRRSAPPLAGGAA
jgi:hypothetical protein